MKTLMTLQNIVFAHNLKPIFDGLSFSINKNEKIGIGGHNGAGKSTLIKLLAGDLVPLDGIITRARNLKFSYVEQYVKEDLLEKTLHEAVLDELDKEVQYLESYKVDWLLEKLFFKESQFSIKVKDLSGGQQNRLMICRAMINEPDLLLLDEPTNHMDVSTLLMIEEYLLGERDLALVVISHDRHFLDRVTNKTVIIRDERGYEFNLSYSYALKNLEKMDQDALKARSLEEREILRLRKSAKRLMIWARTYDNEDLAKKSKSIEKRAKKLEESKTFVTLGHPYSLELESHGNISKVAFRFKDYSVFYGEKLEKDHSNLLFKISSMAFMSGDKIAILGKNGTGKSTFIKQLVDSVEEQFVGDQSLRLSPNLELGLYDQDQEILMGKNNLFDEVRRQVDHLTDEQIRQGLLKMGFKFDELVKKVSSLSGGEKSRLMFLIISLKKTNLLILDEPTNHIDIEGKDELVKSLKKSNGTIILTGHDRHFLDQVATRFVVIDNGELREIHDSKDYYNSLLN